MVVVMYGDDDGDGGGGGGCGANEVAIVAPDSFHRDR